LVYPDGKYEFLCEIENISDAVWSTEPYAFVTEDGKIIVHIRVEKGDTINDDEFVFTLYQCESYDAGRSFTKPHKIFSGQGGAPAHIINNNGTLISVYGYRKEPYGIRAMFSKDNGETWDCDHVLIDDGPNGDIGYPSSVVLEDGSILTVYYAKEDKNSPAVIRQVVWRYTF